ncbi:hypothetical protein [Streptomyces sp. NPDC058773]|uniref:hypothetical protein n=1 Tax=Streptomyces sp. NPDC058773 TaxID=3346632 RepID=UPI003698E359
MNDSHDRPTSAPETRNVSEVQEEAGRLSSAILGIIDLRGEVSKPGPGVSLCGERDPDRFYSVRHAWSLGKVPVADMKKGMERLKEELPGKGWKIVRYGPDSSPSKSLEMVADATEKNFSVSVRLLDRTKRPKPGAPAALISVDLTSGCFQVPKGKTVDAY